MMRFRQPSDLARAINFLLDQLQAGESLELILTQRGQDARVRLHLLEVLSEVARLRQVSVQVDRELTIYVSVPGKNNRVPSSNK